jgi:hypothetical protein
VAVEFSVVLGENMADLEQLKQKYAPVIATMQEFASDGATLDDVSLDGEQLHLKGTVPERVPKPI